MNLTISRTQTHDNFNQSTIPHSFPTAYGCQIPEISQQDRPRTTQYFNTKIYCSSARDQHDQFHEYPLNDAHDSHVEAAYQGPVTM